MFGTVNLRRGEIELVPKVIDPVKNKCGPNVPPVIRPPSLEHEREMHHGR